MKELLLICFLGYALCGFSQTTTNTTYSYVLDEYMGISSDVPAKRKIGGGTKFIVTYEGDWTNEMKGAFEYACKIWEEQIPTALPIRITAKIDYIFSTGNPMSMVSSEGEGGEYDGDLALKTRIKGVYMAEMFGPQFLDLKFANKEWIESADGTIIYNKNRMNEFSFSLYPQSTDKYDFVTFVLRDLARLLGFCWTNQGNSVNQTLDIQGEKLTPFEQVIAEGIGTTDIYEAYKNATRGFLDISIKYGNKMKLYAPDPWVKGVSLNYFIPDSNHKLTEILSYKIGRGSVIRDISDNYSDLFKYGLGWSPLVAVGGVGGGASELPSSTDEVIPYKGEIKLNSLGKGQTVNSQSIDETSVSCITLSNDNDDFEVLNFLSEYCKPYHPNLRSDGTIGDIGWTFSIMKKDGTWDVLSELNGEPSMYPIWIETAKLNFNNVDNYARTYDGYLRTRISSYEYVHYFDRMVLSGRSKYYVLDFLPQKPKMQFVKVMPATYGFVDEYARTIKIAINDLEGTNKIIVEQLDEGETYPQKYEVKDFKKGYFTATVDKEFSSQFTIIAYNDNGNVKSKTLTIEPLEPAKLRTELSLENNCIRISTDNIRHKDKSLLRSYEIYRLDNMLAPVRVGQVSESLDGNILDIGDLRKGIYVISVCNIYNERCNMKFVKQ